MTENHVFATVAILLASVFPLLVICMIVETVLAGGACA